MTPSILLLCFIIQAMLMLKGLDVKYATLTMIVWIGILILKKLEDIHTEIKKIKKQI